MEFERLIQETLCANFGNIELSTALQAAETECDRVAAVQPSSNQEAYDCKDW